jgi:DNA-nicking Smr family endonuclease
LKKREPPKPEKLSSAKLPASPESRPPPPRETPSALSEDYTRGVRPLEEHIGRVTPPDRRATASDRAAPVSTDTVPTFQLRSDENSIEGARVGFGQRLRELARGLLPVFDTLDLHGATVEKAEAAVRSFCANARGQVARTVLIVHGKGLHSPAGQPVLRDQVAHWLSSAPVARDVLCFVTARPKHGGGGAMYVLLAARPPAPGSPSSSPRRNPVGGAKT